MENAPTNVLNQRRYDVDALRVIALALLIFYHIFISYQPFAEMIQFIKFRESLESYWFIGEILNIWRIPILFMISGMGLRFAMERRSLNETIEDRTYRLILPLAFGTVTMIPIYVVFYQMHKGMPLTFVAHPGHLWFVLYIFFYVFFFFPLFVWFKKVPNNKVILTLQKCLKEPWVLFLFILPLWLSTELVEVDPSMFSAFAMIDYHRFWYGALCFLMGFIFISLRDSFWIALKKVCYFSIVIGVACYIYRMLEGGSKSNFMNVLESLMWMLGVMGLGAKFLNQPSKVMSYLSKAVFPVYIMHMPVQQIVAYYLFPMELNVWVTILLHLGVTYAICLGIYEFVLCKLKFIQPFMGMSIEKGRYVFYQKILVVLTCLSAAFLLGGYMMTDLFSDTQSSLELTSQYLGLLVLGLSVICLFIVLSLKNLRSRFFTQRWVHIFGLPFLLCSFILMAKEEVVKVEAKSGVEFFEMAKYGGGDELKSLLEDGNNINSQDESGITALHWAVLTGNDQTLMVLLEAGAKVNVRTKMGHTAMHSATFLGRASMMKALLEHGGDINKKAYDGSQPMNSLYAPWEVVEMIAKQLNLKVDKYEIMEGRKEVAKILINNKS